MERARSGRAIEHTKTVKFEAPDQSEWREQALEALKNWQNKRSWAAVYLRCGKCYREFIEWMEANPISEGWTERAIETIEKNRWI